MRRLLLAIAALLPALLVTGITVSAANSPAQIVNCSTATACYSPNPIRVTVGSTVTWTNGTSIAHTATSDAGVWDTGAIAPGGTSSATRFNTAGTFAYHCTFHSDMHGSVVVSAASISPAATQPFPSLFARRHDQLLGTVERLPERGGEHSNFPPHKRTDSLIRIRKHGRTVPEEGSLITQLAQPLGRQLRHRMAVVDRPRRGPQTALIVENIAEKERRFRGGPETDAARRVPWAVNHGEAGHGVTVLEQAQLAIGTADDVAGQARR